MRYTDTVRGLFSERKNRFIATVTIGGKPETVHVKNTGRLRELLVPGAEVVLQKSSNPARKTGYDLISVYKPALGWVNIDSLAPNAVAGEWLKSQRGVTLVKPEHTYGGSRFDFYVERGERRALVEVKGCTLERGGTGFFPDAPTERGARHLRELAAAAGEGYDCALIFVIAVPGVREVRPNEKTDPGFAAALSEAAAAGVKILHLSCEVTESSITAKEIYSYG